MIYTCQNCGKEFEVKKKPTLPRKYCTRECGYSATREQRRKITKKFIY